MSPEQHLQQLARHERRDRHQLERPEGRRGREQLGVASCEPLPDFGPRIPVIPQVTLVSGTGGKG